MSTPDIPRLDSRSRTYGLMLVAVVGLVAAALVVPVALGRTPPSAPVGLAALPPQQAGSQPLPTADVNDPADPGASPAPSDSGGPAPTGGAAASASARPRTSSVAGPRAGVTGADPGLFGGAGAGASTGTPRTASDKGVTATTVTVGVLLVDLGGVSAISSQAAGSTGYSPAEQQSYFDAYFKAVNDAGGVQGRRLVPTYQIVDVLQQSSSQAACKTFTEGSSPVFVATNVLGVYGPPILCFTKDHATPYIGNDGAVSDYYTQSQGRLFTVQPSTLRTQLDSVDEMFRAGELTGKKVGFLHEDDYLEADSATVAAYVKQLTGQAPVLQEASSSDTSKAQSQLANAAVQMCAQGVNAMFVGVNALYMEEFQSSVDAQQSCHPAYFTSDFDYQMAGDAFLGGQAASYFTHALGTSSSLVGDPRLNRPVRATEQQCLDTYVAGGGTAYQPTEAKYVRAQAVCGLVSSIVRGLAAAGPNPTRAGFATGLQDVGAFDNPGYSASTFTRQKQDAPNQVRVLTADATCKCWIPKGTGDFHLAAF